MSHWYLRETPLLSPCADDRKVTRVARVIQAALIPLNTVSPSTERQTARVLPLKEEEEKTLVIYFFAQKENMNHKIWNNKIIVLYVSKHQILSSFWLYWFKAGTQKTGLSKFARHELQFGPPKELLKVWGPSDLPNKTSHFNKLLQFL